MTYWKRRWKLNYYRIVRQWLDEFGPLNSILDVGCCDTPVATWGQFTDRYAIDLRPRPALIGVRQIIGEWPGCSPLVPVCDVVTCLQVLEHLPDPTPFAAELFARSSVAVILSVPLEWPTKPGGEHVQDPVSLEKVQHWTGRTPDAVEIADDGALRAVLMYAQSHP